MTTTRVHTQGKLQAIIEGNKLTERIVKTSTLSIHSVVSIGIKLLDVDPEADMKGEIRARCQSLLKELGLTGSAVPMDQLHLFLNMVAATHLTRGDVVEVERRLTDKMHLKAALAIGESGSSSQLVPHGALGEPLDIEETSKYRLLPQASAAKLQEGTLWAPYVSKGVIYLLKAVEY